MANLLATLKPQPGAPAAPASPTPIPRERPREDLPPTGERTQAASRTLVVGREIVLSGEISACDRLVVEGTVKANIRDCREIAIAEGGLFTGSASVETAEISGRFEGELSVSGRLMLRASGKVSASVRYREIEIERGGEISGTFHSFTETPAAS
ncbi:MAG TPA: polymer-forming cytoskeletal protein [Stellaceae bacterium]|nr:polymer-forming cytoskeletal protein [Stellaceae bacterium]